METRVGPPTPQLENPRGIVSTLSRLTSLHGPWLGSDPGHGLSGVGRQGRDEASDVIIARPPAARRSQPLRAGDAADDDTSSKEPCDDVFRILVDLERDEAGLAGRRHDTHAFGKCLAATRSSGRESREPPLR